MNEDAALAAAHARIEDYRRRIGRLDDNALDLLFREARNHNWWQDRPVTDDQLREIYDLAKLGPTSGNCLPMRVVFVRSPEAKERLKPALTEPNREKTMLAPATAIVAYDLKFYEEMPRLYPMRPEMGNRFRDDEAAAKTFAFQNGTLQGAYFILATRALGLDAGAMAGFDNAKVDEEFFKGTSWRSNFLMNIGYGDVSGIKGPRLYRYAFDEVCQIV